MPLTIIRIAVLKALRRQLIDWCQSGGLSRAQGPVPQTVLAVRARGAQVFLERKRSRIDNYALRAARSAICVRFRAQRTFLQRSVRNRPRSR